MSKVVIVIVFLAGCVTATSNREEVTINRFFNDRISAETDAVLIKYIEKHRSLALDILAKATNSNVRHKLAIHIMTTTPGSIEEMRTIMALPEIVWAPDPVRLSSDRPKGGSEQCATSSSTGRSWV